MNRNNAPFLFIFGFAAGVFGILVHVLVLRIQPGDQMHRPDSAVAAPQVPNAPLPPSDPPHIWEKQGYYMYVCACGSVLSWNNEVGGPCWVPVDVKHHRTNSSKEGTHHE